MFVEADSLTGRICWVRVVLEGGDVEECVSRPVFDFLGIHRPAKRLKSMRNVH